MAAARKPLPKGNTAAARAVRLHLANHGFGGRGGIIVTATAGRVSVGVKRNQFPDPDETARLVAALTALTAERLLTMTARSGDMFDTYDYTPEEPPVETAPGTVTILAAEYERLREDSATLGKLRAAGMDNREGCDIALHDD